MESCLYRRKHSRFRYSIVRLYTENCPPKDQLERFAFEPSFAQVADEKQENADDTLPIYFRFDHKRKLPLLYDEIQDHRYVPCTESQRWIKQIGPGHLSDGIEEAIGYICKIQRTRKEGYLYDPANLFGSVANFRDG